MPTPLVDLNALNLTEDLVSESELRRMLPQDHEFRMVDGICFLDLEERLCVGYKDWNDKPWWARGHIPGRPIMPGVLMIEGAAQVASVLMRRHDPAWDRFIGLGGVEAARFRGTVEPPCRIYYAAKIGKQSSRLARYPAQAWVDGKIVFEMELLGVLL